MKILLKREIELQQHIVKITSEGKKTEVKKGKSKRNQRIWIYHILSLKEW